MRKIAQIFVCFSESLNFKLGKQLNTVQFQIEKNSEIKLPLAEFKILTWALPCSRVCRKEPNGKMQLISFLVKGSISFYLYCCIYVTARSSQCAISKQRNIFESLEVLGFRRYTPFHKLYAFHLFHNEKKIQFNGKVLLLNTILTKALTK